MPDHGPWCFKQPRDGGTISGRQSVQVRQGAHTSHILIDDVHCRGSAADSHGFASSCSKNQPQWSYWHWTNNSCRKDVGEVDPLTWKKEKWECVSVLGMAWTVLARLDPRGAEFLFNGWISRKCNAEFKMQFLPHRQCSAPPLPRPPNLAITENPQQNFILGLANFVFYLQVFMYLHLIPWPPSQWLGLHWIRIAGWRNIVFKYL